MRKNLKVSKKQSVIVSHMMHLGGVVMLLTATAIVYLLASSSCTALSKAIGEKERTIVKLDKERDMERARWELMKTPERLEAALLKHGLSMHYPKADQIVRLSPGGNPYPGQLSVAKAKSVTTKTTTASYRRSRR